MTDTKKNEQGETMELNAFDAGPRGDVEIALIQEDPRCLQIDVSKYLVQHASLPENVANAFQHMKVGDIAREGADLYKAISRSAENPATGASETNREIDRLILGEHFAGDEKAKELEMFRAYEKLRLLHESIVKYMTYCYGQFATSDDAKRAMMMATLLLYEREQARREKLAQAKVEGLTLAGMLRERREQQDKEALAKVPKHMS